jgi:hypothetical protein
MTANASASAPCSALSEGRGAGDQLADVLLASEDGGEPGERGSGGQHHRHAVPAMRQRMAERMQGAFGQADEAIGDRKDDARSA